MKVKIRYNYRHEVFRQFKKLSHFGSFPCLLRKECEAKAAPHDQNVLGHALRISFIFSFSFRQYTLFVFLTRKKATEALYIRQAIPRLHPEMPILLSG